MPTAQHKFEIRVEKFSLEKVSHLLKEHWEESSRNKEVMVLNPDKEKYIQLENAGNLVTLFAYYDEKVVGYSCNILTNHIHYADLLVAYNDVLFIDKEHRNSPLGLRLIKQTKKAVKEKGVKLLLWHAKENTPLSKILPRLGCSVQEIVYSEQL